MFRVDRVYRRDADTDNVGGIIPKEFGEEYRIEVQTVLFRRNMPNAIGLNFVAFRHSYLGWNTELKALQKTGEFQKTGSHTSKKR